MPGAVVTAPGEPSGSQLLNVTRSPRVPVLARVECRSERAGEDTPLAIWVGGERFEIIDVIDRAVLGGIEAGRPHRHRMWVEVTNGGLFELVRTLPSGRWLVFR